MYQSQRQRGIQNLEAVIKGQTTQIVNDNGQCPEWPKRQKNKVANNDRDLYNNAQNRNATKTGGVRTWVLQNGGTSNYRNHQILPKSPYFYRNHPRYYRNHHQIFLNSFQKER